MPSTRGDTWCWPLDNADRSEACPDLAKDAEQVKRDDVEARGRRTQLLVPEHKAWGGGVAKDEVLVHTRIDLCTGKGGVPCGHWLLLGGTSVTVACSHAGEWRRGEAVVWQDAVAQSLQLSYMHHCTVQCCSTRVTTAIQQLTAICSMKSLG